MFRRQQFMRLPFFWTKDLQFISKIVNSSFASISRTPISQSRQNIPKKCSKKNAKVGKTQFGQKNGAVKFAIVRRLMKNLKTECQAHFPCWISFNWHGIQFEKKSYRQTESDSTGKIYSEVTTWNENENEKQKTAAASTRWNRRSIAKCHRFVAYEWTNRMWPAKRS